MLVVEREKTAAGKSPPGLSGQVRSGYHLPAGQLVEYRKREKNCQASAFSIPV